MIDEARFPEQDADFIFEHLRHYCSLEETLPAITVCALDDGVFVTRGHIYLRIAQELGRSSIRAVIGAGSSDDAVAQLASQTGVVELDWGQIDRVEQSQPIVCQWHVFYFDRPLSEGDKDRFEREVAGFFLRTQRPALEGPEGLIDVRYDDDECRAEFRVPVNLGDESWFADYLAATRTFARQVAGIESFQGRRFRPL